MKKSIPAPPVQTSSRAALEERQLRLQESRLELQRKLSELSYKDATIPYRKMKMEELEIDREEFMVHKSWLDVEHLERYLNYNDYRKAHRAINKSIARLGSELWTEQKALREQEEKEGRAPKLGPDSRGAFIPTLLALYKDPHQSRKRSSQIESQMKKASITVYEARKGAPFKGKIWCCVSQDYFDHVRPTHIVPRTLGPELVDYIFGTGSGSRLDTTDNCLLMHDHAEESFHKGHFVLIPVDASETPILRWRIQKTNLAAFDTDMGRVTLRELDGKEVVFKNNNRPASRFLYYHFVVTLLRNKRDRQEGWENFMAALPTGRPFATIGPYLRESMLLALAKMAGVLDAVEEAKILGGEGETFVEAERLSELEEAEVARRALEAYHMKEEGDDDDDDDDDDDAADDDDDAADDDDDDDEDESSEDVDSDDDESSEDDDLWRVS